MYYFNLHHDKLVLGGWQKKICSLQLFVEYAQVYTYTLWQPFNKMLKSILIMWNASAGIYTAGKGKVEETLRLEATRGSSN